MKKDLTPLVHRYILALHYLRTAPMHKNRDSMQWFVEAEEELFFAATGEKHVVRAARVLGVSMPEPKKKLRQAKLAGNTPKMRDWSARYPGKGAAQIKKMLKKLSPSLTDSRK